MNGKGLQEFFKVNKVNVSALAAFIGCTPQNIYAQYDNKKIKPAMLQSIASFMEQPLTKLFPALEKGQEKVYKSTPTHSVVNEPPERYGYAMPAGKKLLLYDIKTQSIMMSEFERSLPTAKESKSWVPYYANIWEVLAAVKGAKDTMPHNVFSLFNTADQIYHLPNNPVHVVVDAPAEKNMRPAIEPGCRISLKIADKARIKWGKTYACVFAGEMFYCCYILRTGKDAQHVTLKSLNPDFDPRENIALSEISALFEVVSTTILNP